MNRLELSKPNQVLAWIALMSGIQIIILSINIILPVVGYWLTYGLPFINLMVYYRTDLKAFLIYSITTMVLVLFFIQPALETLLFYAFPSWLLGMGYGLALKKKASLLTLMVVLSIVQFGILYIMKIMTLQFYQLDFLSLIYQLLNLDRQTSVTLLDPILVYAIALLQVFMGLLLIYPLIERFQLPVQYQLFFSQTGFKFFIGLWLMTILMLLLAPSLAYFALGPLVFFTIYSYSYLLVKASRINRFILLFSLILYPFINAILSSVFTGPYRIFSVLFLTFFSMVIVLFNSITQKHQNALI